MSGFFHIHTAKKLGLPRIVFFILIFFLATSCAFKKSRIIKQSFKTGKHTVRIVEKDIDDQYLSKKKLGHPHTFTEIEIYNNLKSLKYKRLALFSAKENVFSAKLAKELSPLLVNAFKKASKNDFIEIDVQSSKGRILGNVFIFRRKLNWRYKIINGASYEKRTSRDYLDGWKLVLLKGQKYRGQRELFGVRTAKNWIVYPVGKTWSNAGLEVQENLKPKTDNEFNDKSDTEILKSIPNEQSKKDASLTQKEIETHFFRLKKLMQKGLITKEEYKARKHELLEKYF